MRTIMRKKAYYVKLFRTYPDIVDIPQFRKMLGGIADSTARKLLKENCVKHFSVRQTYYITKSSIIDYVLSDHYAEYCKTLKHYV